MQMKKICIARLGAAHGVRGAMRLWSFSDDPGLLMACGPLQSKDGTRNFRIVRLRAAKDHFVAEIEGVSSREQAQALNGTELFVGREKLPAAAADEFYHADLIGLAAIGTAGEHLGEITAVHNFGAGDIIEVKPASGGTTLMLPFSNAVVPTVDVAGGKVVIDLPNEINGGDGASNE